MSADTDAHEPVGIDNSVGVGLGVSELRHGDSGLSGDILWGSVLDEDGLSSPDEDARLA